MIGFCITVVIVVGIVWCVSLFCYFHYKPKQLEYQKESEKQNAEISVKALELEIAKEHTKQMEIDADAFKTKEETRKYEIKANYEDKHGQRLYY